MYQAFEAKQKDGITVKERIINFFERKLERKEAELIYNSCLECGQRGGVDLFDKAVEIACQELELDSNELSKEIQENTIK